MLLIGLIMDKIIRTTVGQNNKGECLLYSHRVMYPGAAVTNSQAAGNIS